MSRRAGFHHTPETIAKIALSKRGKPRSPETRQKMSLANLGKHHSPETRMKMSLANKGKKRTPEQCQRLREHLMQPELIEKRRLANLENSYGLGYHHTPEARQAIRSRLRGRKNTPEQLERQRIGLNRPEVRARLSLKRRELRHTPEAKEKIRLSHLGMRPPPSAFRKVKELWTKPEFREKMRRLHLGNSHGLGKGGWTASIEKRKKMSLIMQGRWNDPDAARKMHLGLCHTTLPEAEVADILWQDHLVPSRFDYNGRIEAGVIIGGCIPDFVWAERKAIIEVNGGGYHRDIDKFQKRRAKKLKIYEEKGYRVLELWDDELGVNLNPDVISAKIHGLLNGGMG